jgi:serine/threonine-protein kinase Chk2
MHIRHPAVSGLHCSIHNLGNGIINLQDHSTNGTFVRGLVVGKGKTTAINDGDEVVLIKAADRVGYKIIFIESEKKPPNPAELKYKFGETLGKSVRTSEACCTLHPHCLDAHVDSVWSRVLLFSGAFAIVRRCADRRTGQSYAVKIIDKKKFYSIQQSQRQSSLMDEVNILRSADHPGIIKMYDLIETDTTLYLILELVEGGDLFDRIVAQEGKGFTEEVARHMFDQMLQAMKYLHTKSIVHRDLKPENILLVSKTSNDIRISDFGLSRVLGVGSFMKTMCGTPQSVQQRR